MTCSARGRNRDGRGGREGAGRSSQSGARGGEGEGEGIKTHDKVHSENCTRRMVSSIPMTWESREASLGGARAERATPSLSCSA